MRKLKLQMQMSIDGFVGRKDGALDWMTWDWDDKIKQYVDGLTNSIDCILLGRKMTDGFVSHWTNVSNKPDDEGYQFANKMVDTSKVVFTKTMSKSNWANTVIANGDLTDEVNDLKNQNGKDIIVYGGANFVSNLIKARLIDEFHIFINPAAISSGLTIFDGVNGRLNLKLIKSIPFDCGVVLLHYEPIKKN